MTRANIAGGFRGAGLIPFDPEAVISKLDVKIRKPTPTGPPDANTDTWVSQTPRNPSEALSQTELVRNRIDSHQGSFPTHIFSAVKQLAKGMEAIVHNNTLLATELRALRKANEALSKRRRAKKTRIRQGGSLTVEDGKDLLSQKEAQEQAAKDMRENRGGDEARPATIRRCSNRGKPGHNARTCQVDAEMCNV